MKNINIVMKRVCSYMIDIIIVTLFATAITYIPFLKKDEIKYQQKYNEYEEKYSKSTEFYLLLESSYEDNKITEEEYNELIDENLYNELITKSYEDNKISQGEYKKIVSEIKEELNQIKNDYTYILGKIAISDSIIILICTLLYFGVIQYFLNGQTIGKKILKLKVVSATDKEINIANYILRTLIVNSVFLNIIGVIFLGFSSKSTYIQVDSILSTLVSIVEAIIIFLVLTRDDDRGLHDLLFNTKVISTDKPIHNKTINNSTKKIIDADYKEEVKIDGKKPKQQSQKRKK